MDHVFQSSRKNGWRFVFFFPFLFSWNVQPIEGNKKKRQTKRNTPKKKKENEKDHRIELPTASGFNSISFMGPPIGGLDPIWIECNDFVCVCVCVCVCVQYFNPIGMNGFGWSFLFLQNGNGEPSCYRVFTEFLISQGKFGEMNFVFCVLVQLLMQLKLGKTR